ncbi:MAG: class I SAM-dependent methyltransferase [Bacteroidetes bacterium]|nr:class I SAM-dependent methyltransferase [Bacteroidota bacterium]
MISGSETVSIQNIKRAAGILYHIPGEWNHRRKMKSIAGKDTNHQEFFHNTSTAVKAFDDVAINYDKEFTHTRTGQLQREVVHRYLENNLDSETYKNVLELNCGTGEDAIWLSRKGYKVTATDVSSEMIAMAKSKQTGAKEKTEINFLQLPFSKLDQFKDNSFDLLFSNFGGLNCIDSDEISILSKEINRLLRPGGKFIAVLMGRNCVLEKFYFTLKGDKQNKLRRSSIAPVKAKVATSEIDISYYAPNEFAKLLHPYFNTPTFIPVGLFIPPSYLEKPFTYIPGFQLQHACWNVLLLSIRDGLILLIIILLISQSHEDSFNSRLLSERGSERTSNYEALCSTWNTLYFCIFRGA